MNTSEQLPIPPSALLSFVMGPFLLGVVALESLQEALLAIGQASEEIFRGDRLPVLKIANSDEREG